MAVYTQVSDAALAALLSRYDIGDAVEKTPILEGVENTNYKIRTTTGAYILTIFEKRAPKRDLPFFMAFQTHLWNARLPVAKPILSKDGEVIEDIHGKPAAILEFISGAAHLRPNPSDCAEMGAAMGRMQSIAQSFDQLRPNPLSIGEWRALAQACEERADECADGLSETIKNELSYLEANWPEGLPSAPVHADLFPDNVLFDQGRISGVIDFYFSCTDFLAYDFAVCANAWCFDDDTFISDNYTAIAEAYRRKREFTSAEFSKLPTLFRGAALRFLLTRLYDWLNPVENAMVAVKNPLEYRNILRFHQENDDPTFYRR